MLAASSGDVRPDWTAVLDDADGPDVVVVVSGVVVQPARPSVKPAVSAIVVRVSGCRNRDIRRRTGLKGRAFIVFMVFAFVRGFGSWTVNALRSVAPNQGFALWAKAEVGGLLGGGGGGLLKVGVLGPESVRFGRECPAERARSSETDTLAVPVSAARPL